MAPLDVRLRFYAFRRADVDDAEHPPALLALSNDNFDGVGGRAEYRAHLRYVSGRIHHIDGVGILQYQQRFDRIVPATAASGEFRLASAARYLLSS